MTDRTTNRATMLSRTYPILGCPCEAFVDLASIRQRLSDLVEGATGGYTVAINAEKIERYSRDPELSRVIDRATLTVPDGGGAVMGLRVLHGIRSIKVDLPRTMFEEAGRHGWTTFMGGAKQDSNEKAVAEAVKQFPGLRVVGAIHGYADQETIMSEISRTGPQIVMLAMGSPRQEILAGKIVAKFPGILVVGCGGAFDILAGKMVRAPRFMVDNYLEWLYRLYKEPSRWRRQLVLPRFLVRLLLYRACEAIGVQQASRE